MPALLGGIRIITVSTAGVFQVGDTAVIAPKETGKLYTGSGTFSTGDGASTFTLFSNTNTNDPDFVDTDVWGVK
ncbi:spore germination protein [Effusibacillus dendaii]|uniref:Spore germination protein n=1 Tax=Effusibacillus dendaii TaxID=2743772 RepID=A0A7I8D9I6_9BACL|nr:spore germination protein [Effusibacillus dendaii]BCJ86667.1 hypothetical protein skT53_16520 [Effusibacillus dendaii]